MHHADERRRRLEVAARPGRPAAASCGARTAPRPLGSGPHALRAGAPAPAGGAGLHRRTAGSRLRARQSVAARLSARPRDGGAGLSRRLRAARPYLRLSLYIAAFLIVINPLFSRGGLDVVWHAHLGLFDLTVTVQGLLFGLGSALRLCVVVWAFALYNVVLDADDQLALMSSVSFRSGLVVSLATRLFPVLSRDAARISDAQRARGVELDRGRRRDRVAARLPLLGALLTQSLERATDVAESMEARGYGRRGRARLEARPPLACRRPAHRRGCLGAAAALVAGLVLGAFRFSFFPLLDDPWGALLDPVWLVVARDAGADLHCRAACAGAQMAPLVEQCREQASRTPIPGGVAPALRNVSLQFGAAEVVLVLGGSGSGKSTLLRALNGLVPHFHGGSFAGRVLVAGKDTRARAPRIWPASPVWSSRTPRTRP